MNYTNNLLTYKKKMEKKIRNIRRTKKTSQLIPRQKKEKYNYRMQNLETRLQEGNSGKFFYKRVIMRRDLP